MVDLIDLMEARDAAIAVAGDHANAITPGWSDSAFTMLGAFAKAATRAFLAEEVRAYAEAAGLPSPPDPRAWGGVFQRAARAGLIVREGFTTSRNRQAHMRPTASWRLAA